MFRYKKYKDMAAITSYEGNEKVVIIPEEIDGLKVHRIASMTFFCNDSIEELHFPEGVIIENNVIVNCDNLKKVFIKDFKTMGNFIEDCEDLIVICDSDRTQKKLNKIFNFDWLTIKRLLTFKTIENEDGTLTISSVYIPTGETIVEIPNYIDGKKVTNLKEALFYGKTLKKVVLNNFIKEISPNCFNGVDTLETIENIQNIEVIHDGAFSSCFDLCLNFEEMKNLKSIGESAFAYNGKIQSIKIKSGVTIDRFAFMDMSGLKILDLSDFDGDFIPRKLCYCCHELEKVILPTHNIGIKESAFACCYKLTNIENEDYIESVGREGFYNCKALVLGIDGSNLKEVCDGAFQYVSFREDLKFRNIKIEMRAFLRTFAYLRDAINITFTKDYTANVIPKSAFAHSHIDTVFFDTTIDKVEESAFYQSRLRKLMRASFKEIESYAFSTSNLEEFKATERLEKIGCGAFSQCRKLEIIDFEKSNITELPNGLFSGNDIKNLKLPKNLTKLSSIFYNSTLGELILPDSITSLNCESFKYAKIKRLVLSKNISKIPSSCFYGFVGSIEVNGIIEEVSREAFMKANISNLDLSKAIFKEIPYSCFKEFTCSSLKLPNTVEKIGDYCFHSSKIKTLKNLSNLNYIGRCAFANTNLLDFDIDFSTVRTLGERAFFHSTMPNNMTFKNVYIGLEVFSNNMNLSNVTILGNSFIERKNFEGRAIIHIEDSKLRNKIKNRTFFKANPKFIQKI